MLDFSIENLSTKIKAQLITLQLKDKSEKQYSDELTTNEIRETTFLATKGKCKFPNGFH